MEPLQKMATYLERNVEQKFVKKEMFEILMLLIFTQLKILSLLGLSNDKKNTLYVIHRGIIDNILGH